MVIMLVLMVVVMMVVMLLLMVVVMVVLMVVLMVVPMVVGGLRGATSVVGTGTSHQVEPVRLLMCALNRGLDVLVASVDALWKGDATRAAATLLVPEYVMGGWDFRSSVLIVQTRPISIAAWTMLAECWDSNIDILSIGLNRLNGVARKDFKFGRLLQPSPLVIVLDDFFRLFVTPNALKSRRDKLHSCTVGGDSCGGLQTTVHAGLVRVRVRAQVVEC